MTVRSWLSFLPLLFLSGCSALPIPGFAHSPGARSSGGSTFVEPCRSSSLNSVGVLSWLNRSVGKMGGFDRPVSSLSGTADTAISDRQALKLPSNELDGRVTFSCYATAHFQDGTWQDGILSIADEGANQPLRVQWIDRSAVERARVTYAADVELRQQQSIAYGARLQACTFQWKVAVHAMSLLRSGMSESAVEEQLVTNYAYGPQELAYRDSQATEAIVRQVSAAMAMTPEQRALKHMPDFASQEFLVSCQKL